MNILFISPNSPKISTGGVERYIENLIDFLKDRPGKYFFLLPAENENLTEKNGNIFIFHKNFLSLPPQTKISPDIIKKKSGEFFLFLSNLFKNEKIDIVSAQNFHLGLPPAFNLMVNMACCSQKIPLVLRLHSFPVTEIQSELVNQLFWDKFFCVSRSVAGDCFQKGTDIKKLITHHLGVNRHRFNEHLDKNWLKKELNLPTNSKIILSASRIILGRKEILKEKGIIDLIEAFSKLKNRYKNLQLVYAVAKAPETLQEEFNRAQTKLLGFLKLYGIEESAKIKTFPLEQMPLAYRGADIFVLPSENETFGQVFIESMACGTPVIGTKVGGIPEIISDNYNGYLVPVNDPISLSQKMESLLTIPHLKDKFINKGLKTIDSKFTAKQQFSKLLNHFSTIVND